MTVDETIKQDLLDLGEILEGRGYGDPARRDYAAGYESNVWAMAADLETHGPDEGDMPNFVFFGTDTVEPLVIGWYKYVGRSQVQSRPVNDIEWEQIRSAILADLGLRSDALEAQRVMRARNAAECDSLLQELVTTDRYGDALAEMQHRLFKSLSFAHAYGADDATLAGLAAR